MNILHLTTTDPAGAVYNFVNALNVHTPHTARLITTHRIPEFNFQTDVHWIFDAGDEIEALLEQADVIHMHKEKLNFKIELNMPKAGIKRIFSVQELLKKYPNKKVLYHIHGHPYERGYVKENAEEYASMRARVLTSTPDLEEMYRPYYKDVTYFPNCVPVFDVHYMPRPTDKPVIGTDGKECWIVSQTPTNNLLKDVALIEDAVKEASKIGIPVAYNKIMGVSQEMALRQKRISHIVFDHVQGYYGLSSLEGLSMGKPVIAGLSEYSLDAIHKFFKLDSPHPWVVARTQQEITQKIVELCRDIDKRRAIGSYGRKFMEEVWNDRIIAKRLAILYSSL